MSGRAPRGGGKGVRGGAGSSTQLITDGMVREKEDQLIIKATKDLSNGSLPCRPAFGTAGAKAQVRTNHFYLDIDRGLKVQEYSIAIVRAKKQDTAKDDAKKDKAQNTTGEEEEKEITGRVRKELVRKLLRILKEEAVLADKPNQGDFISDFANKLYLARGPALFGRTTRVLSITLWRKSYEVEVKHVKEHNLSTLFDYIDSFGKFDNNKKHEALLMLNIWLRHNSKKSLSKVVTGSKTFHLNVSESDHHDLGGGLTALRGVFATIRTSTSRILANIQTARSPFFAPHYLSATMRAHIPGLEGTWTHNNLDRVHHLVRRLKVEATHLTEKRNGQTTYKTVSGLARNTDGGQSGDYRFQRAFGAKAHEIEFKWDGVVTQPGAKDQKDKPVEKTPKKDATGGQRRWITVEDYYKRVYKFTPSREFPVLNVGSELNPSYMPVDKLVVAPGQFSRVELTGRQTTAMLDFGDKGPDKDLPHINEGYKLLEHAAWSGTDRPQIPDAFATFRAELVTVEGRWLNSVPVHYSDPPKNPSQAKGNPTWNLTPMQNRPYPKMSRSTGLDNWNIVFIGNQGQIERVRKDPNRVRDVAVFSQTIAELFYKHNVTTSATQPEKLYWSIGGTSHEDLYNHMNKLSESQKAGHLVLVLMANSADRPDVFHTVKYLGDVLVGVKTTCLQDENLQKQLRGGVHRLRQYLANVALKVNLRNNGGCNQRLVLPKVPQPPGTLNLKQIKKPFEAENFFGVFQNDPTMIVGMDVTHPSAGEKANPAATSIAAMVASTDWNLGQWPAELRVQTAAEEMVENIRDMLKAHLTRWLNRHKSLPVNILFYRDGVAESQYKDVIDKELTQLWAACRDVYGPPPKKLPRITLVIAGKRHHVRFYPVNGTQDRDSLKGNPRPGLVVDRGVTEARNWDFYLQAHKPLKGTARPVHYYVLHDEIFTHYQPFKKAADVTEAVTHQLSYIFGRSTTAVSLCTPVSYAHLACERARSYTAFHKLRKDWVYKQHSGRKPASQLQRPKGNQTWDLDMLDAVILHPRLRDVMFYI